jgi:hypothetical protein
MTRTTYCLACGIAFQALRSTAVFCGGTCRQRFNRALRRWEAEHRPATSPPKPNITADIALVRDSVDNLAQSLQGNLLFDEAISPLEEALEQLNEIVNPSCQSCGEKRADGWENVEYCRGCEITIFELRCQWCDTRRPSIKSDDMLCRQCAKGEVAQ